MNIVIYIMNFRQCGMLRNPDGRKKTAMPVAFYFLSRLKYLVQNLEKIKGCVREKVK